MQHALRKLNDSDNGQFKLDHRSGASTASSGLLEGSLHADSEMILTQLQHYNNTIEKVQQGVCIFDEQFKMIAANRRFAEIYGLDSEDIAPGVELREIAERRRAAGSFPAISVDDYITNLKFSMQFQETDSTNVTLRNGQVIVERCQRMLDGGFVTTHADITELTTERVSLQTILDWMPDYLWIKDAQSRYILANRALARDRGRASAMDMRGLSDFDIHPRENARRLLATEQILMKLQQPLVDSEEYVVNTDGVGKWMSSTKIPIVNSNGNVLGIIGVSRDITERRRETELRRCQAQIHEMIALGKPLDEILDQLLHLSESQFPGVRSSILLLQCDGTCARHSATPSSPRVHRGAVDGVGMSGDKVSRGTEAFLDNQIMVSDVMSAAQRDEYSALAESDGYQTCWSMLIRSREGGLLAILEIYSKRAGEPSANEKVLIDSFAYIAGIAIERDLTEAKLRRQTSEIETANSFLTSLLGNMKSGVAMFDNNKRLLYHNPAYAQMYGISRDDIPPGTPLTKILELRIANGLSAEGKHDDYVLKCLDRMESSADRDYSEVEALADGRFVRVTLQRTADGGWIKTHEDVTAGYRQAVEQRAELEALVQRRTAEIQQKSEELRLALVRQQAINEQQRNFVSMASHEFRTPLAIIDSAAQKLHNRAERIQPSDILSRAETIRRNVQRITGLMESVLAAARFEDGAVTLYKRNADLQQVVVECCQRHSDVSARHRIDVDVGKLPRLVNFDVKAIDQVLTNLIANAIKFSPDATIVKVSGRTEACWARIDVEDFGIGIDADDLSTLFTRFFRAKTSVGIAGTGIGLNVVKMLVELHGGQVQAISVKGKGSVFSIFLPLIEANISTANYRGDPAGAFSLGN